MALLKIAAALFVLLITKGQATIPDEDWSYITVRPQAHMFWWLYGATSPQRAQLPLILWLQGGPGGSGTGFGNFGELGPLDVSLKPRSTTWVQAANVLFIDNPVGTGYSYVDSQNAYTRNVSAISADLLVAMKTIVTKYPEFQTLPFWIFCESYGGKMTAHFGATLQKAILAKTITMNFKGVALGDSWISPTDYTSTWGPYLQALSVVDQNEAGQIKDAADAVQQACSSGQWEQATDLWGNEEQVVEEVSDGVDFYNVLIHNSEARLGRNKHETPRETLKRNHLAPYVNDDLNALMNGPIRQKLKIIPAGVTWGGQSGAVFDNQAGDFMKDVISSVDQLLSYGLSVHVYNGQLDVICDTLGTENWMQQLNWSGMPQFNTASKIPLYPSSGTQQTGAFVKNYKNLSLWFIMMAGHMVPSDNGPMALKMVQMITSPS
jgi:serine carboxypeptidase 1